MTTINIRELRNALAAHRKVNIVYDNGGVLSEYICLNRSVPFDSGDDHQLSFGDNSILTNKDTPKRYTPLSFGNASRLSSEVDNVSNEDDTHSDALQHADLVRQFNKLVGQGIISQTNADLIIKNAKRDIGKTIYAIAISKDGEKYTKPQYKSFSIKNIKSFKVI